MKGNHTADIKVLYERISNIDKSICEINERLKQLNSQYSALLANYTDNQKNNEHRISLLEERTETLKYFVYTSVILAIGAIISTVAKIIL